MDKYQNKQKYTIKKFYFLNRYVMKQILSSRSTINQNKYANAYKYALY